MIAARTDRDDGLRRFASVAEEISESQERNRAEQLDGEYTLSPFTKVSGLCGSRRMHVVRGPVLIRYFDALLLPAGLYRGS